MSGVKVSQGVYKALALTPFENELIRGWVRERLREKSPDLSEEIGDIRIAVNQTTPIYDPDTRCAKRQIKVTLTCHLAPATIAMLQGVADEAAGVYNNFAPPFGWGEENTTPAIKLVDEIATREELMQEAGQLSRRLAAIHLALG